MKSIKTRDDITVEKVYRSVHAVTVNGNTCNGDCVEVFKRKDGTWGMDWMYESYKQHFDTMNDAVEAAIPIVLDHANRSRGF